MKVLIFNYLDLPERQDGDPTIIINSIRNPYEIAVH